MQMCWNNLTGVSGKGTGIVLCLLLVLVAGWPGFVAHGQSSERGEVRIIVDGEHVPEFDSLSWHADPLEIGASALNVLNREGYHLAEIEDVRVNFDTDPPLTTVTIHQGPEIPVGKFEIRGLDDELKQLLVPELSTQEGDVLLQENLEHDINRMLNVLETEGYPLAHVTIDKLQIQSDADSSLAVIMQVDKGETLVFGGISVDEDVRASTGFLSRVIGMQEGDPLDTYDPQRIREDLQATELFTDVGEPAVEVQDGQAILHLSVEEERPGVFDFVLGYQPNEQGGGSFIGGGHIQLSNPFGGGRGISFRLDQRPGSISQIEVSARDPYILQTPFSAGVGFKGRQQDSTYNQQTYRIEAGYNLRRFLDVHLTAERTQTQPGVAADRSPHPASSVNRASRNLFGAGISFHSTRHRLAPRQGYQMDLHAARGFQQRRMEQNAGGASVETVPQETISGRFRAFFSPGVRHVIAVGAEGETLISEMYDAADLIRLGGAGSLRGYDEEQFAGWMAGRMLAEYRFMTGVRSYAYLFSDLGYIHETELGVGSGERRLLPGFGAGAQIETAIGIFTVAYAINDQDAFMDGRLHLQLSVGL